MTDNEIIKALECCEKLNHNAWSENMKICKEECPYKANCYDEEKNINMIADALDLINRQQAEIERLEEDSKRLKKVQMQLDDLCIMHYTIRAEAIKEFAERLKKEFLALEYQAKATRKTVPIDFMKDQMKWVLHEVYVETIDNLVKEMVGEE